MQLKYTYNSVSPGLQHRAPLPVYYHDANLKGYQGSEKDDEVKGEGNSYTTEFRMLDPRLGRWLSIDPLAGHFPWQSPYVSMDNNPICLNDKLGLSTEGGDDGGGDDWKFGNLTPVKINPINGAGVYQTDEGRYVYKDECGDVMFVHDEVNVTPENEASYQSARYAMRDGTLSQNNYVAMYKQYNWQQYDYNYYKLSKEEQWKMLHPDRTEIDQLGMICFFAIGVPLMGAFGGLFIMEAAAPSLYSGANYIANLTYQNALLYHNTLGVNGGYVSLGFDFGMQTVRNGGINGDMNFFSLGTSAFVPFGSSWGKHLFQIGSSTYVDVSWNSGIMFGAGNYDHASNFSNIFMDAYGRSKYGTPLLGIYWNLMMQGSIGNLERGNNADGTPRQ